MVNSAKSISGRGSVSNSDCDSYSDGVNKQWQEQ